MGLDMYMGKMKSYKNDHLTFEKARDLLNSGNYRPLSLVTCQNLGIEGTEIKDEDGGTAYIVECHQPAYWRKTNHIRGWFERNLEGFGDNCATRIEDEQLDELKGLCQDILAEYEELEKEHGEGVYDYYNSHDTKASELLPPTEGFFFGCSSYGEWYFEDLELTIENIEEVQAIEGGVAYYDEWY